MADLIDEEARRMSEELKALMIPGNRYIACVITVPDIGTECAGGMVCTAENVSGLQMASAYGTMIGKLMHAVDTSAALMNRQNKGRGDKWKSAVVMAINMNLEEDDNQNETVMIKPYRGGE